MYRRSPLVLIPFKIEADKNEPKWFLILPQIEESLPVEHVTKNPCKCTRKKDEILIGIQICENVEVGQLVEEDGPLDARLKFGIF